MVKQLVLTMTSLGLAACGAAGPAKAPGPRATALTPTVAEMVATVDGEPMPLVGAAAVSHGSSAVTVILSTHALPCSAFEASGRVTADGQRDIELSFSPRVQPDGALALVATEARFARRTLTDKAALKGLKLVGGDAGQPLQIIADYAAKEAADDFLKRPAISATLKGKAVAAGCGTRLSSVDADLTARPQPGATLTYAGHTLPIRGATISDSKLRLSTGRLDCRLKGRADLILEVRLPDKLEPKFEVKASGDLLGGNSNFMVTPKPAEGAPPKAWLQVTPGAKPTDPKAPQPVALSGTFEAYDHPVALEGTVQAQRCR